VANRYAFSCCRWDKSEPSKCSANTTGSILSDIFDVLGDPSDDSDNSSNEEEDQWLDSESDNEEGLVDGEEVDNDDWLGFNDANDIAEGACLLM